VAGETRDLAIIGAGPGGYVAAIRAAQLGRSVTVVEREAMLGGTCLRVGCIPSKALLESSERYAETRSGLARHGIEVGEVRLDLARMQARKSEVVAGLGRGIDSLFARHAITRIQGTARIEAPGRVVVESAAGRSVIEARSILIATGSRPAELRGVELDGERIGTSTEALAYAEVPGHLVVIGAGYIGLELGSVWSRLGARVTVLEALDRALPGMDEEIAAEAERVLARQGLEFRLGVKVKAAGRDGDGCAVEVEGGAPLAADRVLVAVGRSPNTAGLGLEAVGVATDARGRIVVDAAYATSVAGIYAVGDVIGGAMLAHKAEDEGIACVERLVTGYGHVNYDAIPGVVYTDPEIAAVGRTEAELRAARREYRKGVFAFRANARARCIGAIDGRVKVLADAATDRILGVHAIGPRAGDLIAEAAVAIEFGASAEDVARSSHAHPSLSEALREACLAVDRRAIHA
jgi:dihydrolipoamide dehydrogenase